MRVSFDEIDQRYQVVDFCKHLFFNFSNLFRIYYSRKQDKYNDFMLYFITKIKYFSSNYCFTTILFKNEEIYFDIQTKQNK